MSSTFLSPILKISRLLGPFTTPSHGISHCHFTSVCKGARVERSWCWPAAPFAHLLDRESTRPSFNLAGHDPRSTTGWTSCQWLHTGAAASRSMCWRAAGSHAYVLIYSVIKHSLFSWKKIMHKSSYGSKKFTEIAAAPLEPFHCSQPTNKIMMQ